MNNTAMLHLTVYCTHLSELVLLCDRASTILYANPAAQKWSSTPLTGQPFQAVLATDAHAKSISFLDAARVATIDTPTSPWELMLGDTNQYSIVNFRGYANDDLLIAIGDVESEQISTMQHEMLLLTSDLAEVQRELRRQNRALKHALDEERRLLQTIQDLTVPAVPIWDGVLLLPIVGHLDSHRANNISNQLLQLVADRHARYVILDVSGIAVVDTAVAQHLMQTAQSLRLLGTQAILVGISPEIAQTIVQLGLHIQDFIVRGDLQQAVAYVLQKTRRKL